MIRVAARAMTANARMDVSLPTLIIVGNEIRVPLDKAEAEELMKMRTTLGRRVTD